MMKGQKGITLVALVITIIVMLILVGVSVTVALNGGLFTTAETAVTNTEEELIKENRLDNGNVIVTIDGEETEVNILDHYGPDAEDAE